MGPGRQWGEGPGTGDTVYVRELNDLARFKAPGGNAFVIKVPVVFTHTGLFDLLDCGLEVHNDGLTTGGSLHGMGGVAQILTASALAGPLITFRGNAVVTFLSVAGAFQAFDLDGTAAGPNAIANLGNVVCVSCPSLGTVDNYASFIVGESAFASCGGLAVGGMSGVIFDKVNLVDMSGGVVLSGAFGTATFKLVSFQPRDGVTALSVPPSPVSSFVDTLDVDTCRFILAFAGAVGLAVSDATVMNPDALDVLRGLFTNGAGGPPVGTPIPSPGYLNATYNRARLARCTNEPNSVTVCEITMNGNLTATTADGTNAVKVAGDTTEQRASKLTADPDDNRVTFAGGIPETLIATYTATVDNGSNEAFELYLAVGTTTPPVAAAIVPHTVAKGATGAAGRSAQVVVQLVDDFAPGEGKFVELWMKTDGTDLRVADLHGIVSMLPA